MLWVCLDCTTPYAVGLGGCPHCGSTRYAEGDADLVAELRADGPDRVAAEGSAGEPDGEPAAGRARRKPAAEPA